MSSLKSNKENQKKNNIIFLSWLILIMLNWILGTNISPILIDFIKELSFEEIQLAESLFNYIIALTILFWGFFVDHFNDKRKLILILSSILWISASIILFFIQTTFIIYCIVQILWGLSFGASGPLIASYIGDLFKIENRGKLFSVFTIFIYIIKGSNIAINGILGEFIGNWKAPTFIFAIASIFVIIIFYFFIEEPSIALNEPEFQNLESFQYEFNIQLNEIKVIVKKKTNFLFLLQGIFGMIGVVIVTRYMNYWFTSSQFDGLNINTSLAILLLGSGGALGGLVGIITVGRWIDLQFKKGLINRILLFSITCLFLQVIFYAILILGIMYPSEINENLDRIDLFLTLYPSFVGFIIVFNICVFCGTPIGTTVGVARTHVNLPEHRGTAGSLYDLTDYIGAGISIMIGTVFILVAKSYRITILLGALFWLISGVIWILIVRVIKEDYFETRNILKDRVNI